MSADRKSDLKRLRQLFRGELDWIVMKALEKDRSRRYETANGFAMDVQRYLTGEPVLAVPPSAAYRVRKFARRNRVALTTAALVVMALLAGTGVSVWQAVRATRAGARADADRAAAEAAQARTKLVNQFLADVIKELAPEEHSAIRLEPDLVLRKAVEKMEADPALARHPDVEASIRFAIGDTYQKLGLEAEAETQFRRAVHLRQEALGRDHSDTLAAQEALAWVVGHELRRPRDVDQLSQETLDACRRVLGPDHPTTLEAMTTRGVILQLLGRLPEADAVLRECWDRHRSVYGPTNVKTLRAQNNVGALLIEQGKWELAEDILRPCLQGFRDTGAFKTELAMSALNNLSYVLYQLEQFEEAVRLLREGREVMLQIYTPKHPGSAHLQHQLSRALLGQKKYSEAETECKKALTMRRALYPDGQHEHIGRSLLLLGRIQVESDKPDDAETNLREARDLFKNHYQSQKALIGETESWLGAALLGRKKYAEAQPLLVNGYELMKAQPGAPAKYVQTALEHIIKLYEDWGKPEEAARLRGERKKSEPPRD